jgi:hypothetical protein
MEASLKIHGLGKGIWKRSLLNISRESCLHAVINHNINLDRQANLRYHTKVLPVLVIHINRLRGLNWITSLQPISRAMNNHPLCCTPHKLSRLQSSFQLPEIPHYRASEEPAGVNCLSTGSVSYFWSNDMVNSLRKKIRYKGMFYNRVANIQVTEFTGSFELQRFPPTWGEGVQRHIRVSVQRYTKYLQATQSAWYY